MIMEVNSSPGLEGIQKTTSVDVAGAIFEYLEREVTPVGGNAEL
jgi:ribosomal protein S6--L-glutamate ligase